MQTEIIMGNRVRTRYHVALLLLALTPYGYAQQESVTILCGVQQEWCQAVQREFAKETGIKVNMTRKSAGEAFEQLRAESGNPKADIWFGGTGDSHLHAARNDLTLAYQSPNIHLLHEWAVDQAKKAGYKTVGLYAGPLGFAYNKDILKAEKLAAPACWSDLAKPEYRGKVQMANPHSSGTAFMAIATLVQIHGEDKAFQYLKALHRNISQYPRQGTAPLKNTARGENAVSISFIHDVPGEVMAGYPLASVAPCEGTGYEIGSMSIVKGARNLANAKRFYDWALTAPAQDVGAATRQFQLSSNIRAAIAPQVPDMTKIRFIPYDFRKYGDPSERNRLLERWEKEVIGQPGL